MKYIMLQDENGMRYPFIFSERLVHADVAQTMSAFTFRKTGQFVKPLSAGFFMPGTNFTCYGESETLRLKSRPVDEAIIGVGDSGASMPDAFLEPVWQKAKLR